MAFSHAQEHHSMLLQNGSVESTQDSKRHFSVLIKCQLTPFLLVRSILDPESGAFRIWALNFCFCLGPGLVRFPGVFLAAARDSF